MSARITRRGFLRAAGAGAAWVAIAGTLGCEPENRVRANVPPKKITPPDQPLTFRSRPDLKPPAIGIGSGSGATDGYVFLAPKVGAEEAGETGERQSGPLIVDGAGQPVWFLPFEGTEEDAMDFRAQTYRDEPVLTYWRGTHTGYGQGEYVILDSSYQEIALVRAGNGYQGDHHEFLLTPRGTALITVYNAVPIDLTSIGGPAKADALDGIAQEVDVETGEVLFEWHSLDHVGIEESYYEPEPDLASNFDYFHINSVEVDEDDNFLISARRTCAVYKVDRDTGEIIWRLGGKRSDFEMGSGADFRYQHDARHQTDGTITVFDNGGVIKDDQSVGLVLELDEDAMTASRVRGYTDGHLAATQGNLQMLPNGNAFVGWGSEPFFSEFGPEGNLLLAGALPSSVESYRAFRAPWTGRPTDDPAAAAERGTGDEVTVYASWNGATEVASWEIVAGPTPDGLEPVKSADRTGFETAITARTPERWVGARAKDRSGRVLGTSRAISVDA